MSQNPFAGLLPAHLPRTYYAKRLLEHGHLSQQEFTEITGWPSKEAARVLTQLVHTQVATRVHELGCHSYVYELR